MQQPINGYPQTATPEMYAQQPPPIPPLEQPPKKKANIFLLIGIIILILLLVVFALLFLLTRKKYQGVVDPSTLTSQCTAGTKLTWWMPNTPQTQPAMYTEIISKFNEGRTKAGKGAISIENFVREYDQYDYYSNLIGAMAKNAGPDIFMLRNDDLTSYRDYILPLASYDKNKVERYKADFVDLVGQETVLGDKLYGVATYVDTLQLYYNKELLDQNGQPTAATTWKDVQAQSRVLSKAKLKGFDLSTISLGVGNPTNGGASNITYVQDIIPTLIAQYGGTFYDNKSNTITFKTSENETTNAFSDALQFYTQFSDNTAQEYSWDEFMGNNVDEFLQNRLVYLVGYKELDKILKEKRGDLDFQVTSLPQVNVNAKRTLGKYFVSVLSRSLDPNQSSVEEKSSQSSSSSSSAPVSVGVKRACAEEFLDYLTSLEAQKSYISQSLMPSAHRKILEDQAGPSGDQKTRVFAQGAMFAINYFKPNVLETERIWGDLVTEARSKKDIKSALTKAVEKYSLLVQSPQIRRK